jgi:hypothetical protein
MAHSLHFSPATSRKQLRLPDPPVNGINPEWLPQCARICHDVGLSETEAFTAIMSRAAGQLRPGRQLSRSEVERAIATIYSTPAKAGSGTPKPKALPPHEADGICPPATEEQARGFADTSPQPHPGTLPTAEILVGLFGPDEFIALKPVNQCRTEKCRVCDLPGFFARARQPYQFVTSSPVTGNFGQTQDGKLSFAALECFTAQRYVVIEFDNVPPRSQFARILWLKEKAGVRAPLVMMLNSGGKSFHAWFQPDSEDAADQLKTAAVKLGADPAAMRVHQSVRCPNQTRDNGNPQEVLWLAAPSFSF